MENLNYCNSFTEYGRLKTSTVQIGDIPMGGDYPIRIQSMTNTNTLNTKATIEQTIRIIEAGADYVRITAPGVKDAGNLKLIKEGLRKKGFKTPLIADIHFNPKAAEIAAQIVEKVRINPGNYVDKKKFKQVDFTDIEYQEEIEKIRTRFVPLIKICRQNGTAMRIGTNHGSLSDRIMSRYGDTPLGMVESTMEFLRICIDENYRDVVVSLKSSNTRVMVQAYRLIVSKMKEENMLFPLHLGVTEAGSGNYGRIKSAVGIGALLTDGIGDTIRVSLTESPEKELPAALSIVNYFNKKINHDKIKNVENRISFSPYEYRKRESTLNKKMDIGAHSKAVVIVDFDEKSFSKEKLMALDTKPDLFFINNKAHLPNLTEEVKIIVPYEIWKENRATTFALLNFDEHVGNKENIDDNCFVEITNNLLLPENLEQLKHQDNIVLVLYSNNKNCIAEIRNSFFILDREKIKNPVIIKLKYNEKDANELNIKAAADLGALLTDGYGDGIWIVNEVETEDFPISNLAFDILQSGRVRTTKAEYISCPSCGRTLFDLETVTKQIQEETAHLIGIKIGIMGCIVNGPGEMADADYGYVGSGKEMIDLYKGHTIIKRKISSDKAVDELIQLIKNNGDWK